MLLMLIKPFILFYNCYKWILQYRTDQFCIGESTYINVTHGYGKDNLVSHACIQYLELQEQVGFQGPSLWKI